jgi:hypothetical protein
VIAATDFDGGGTLTTDGEIAVINLDSARRRSWSRFFQDPLRDGAAEVVFEHEQLTSQFVGDISALDRIEFLVAELVQADAASARTALIQAKAASMLHRFDDARLFLARAETAGASADDVQHLLLNIDQACGVNLHKVLGARRQVANRYNRLEDLVALGSLLADIHAWDDADRTYRRALSGYQDVSPFPLAWACFQLGVLWGELVPEPKRARAAECIKKPSMFCRVMRRRGCIWLKYIYLTAAWTPQKRCFDRSLVLATRRSIGAWLTCCLRKASSSMPMRRWKQPATGSKIFSDAIYLPSQITVRSSTRAVATTPTEPFTWRASMSPIDPRGGRSNRRTTSPNPWAILQSHPHFGLRSGRALATLSTPRHRLTVKGAAK